MNGTVHFLLPPNITAGKKEKFAFFYFSAGPSFHRPRPHAGGPPTKDNGRPPAALPKPREACSPTAAPRPAPGLHVEATPTGSINNAQPSTPTRMKKKERRGTRRKLRKKRRERGRERNTHPERESQRKLKKQEKSESLKPGGNLENKNPENKPRGLRRICFGNRREEPP